MLQADDRLQRGTGFPPGNLWFAYQRWLRTQGVTDPWHGEPAQLQHGELHRIAELQSRRAPGNTCLAGLCSDLDVVGSPGYPIAANESKGCGGVTRAAPCGLVNWDERDVFKIGAAAAALKGNPARPLPPGARS